MFLAFSFVKTKYHIESLGYVLTAVGLTSVAITLLHFHLAQILSGCRAVQIGRYSVDLSSKDSRARQTSLGKMQLQLEYLYSSSDVWGHHNPLLEPCKLSIAITTASTTTTCLVSIPHGI